MLWTSKQIISYEDINVFELRLTFSIGYKWAYMEERIPQIWAQILQ